MTVNIDIENLTASKTAITTLASTIDSARQRASNGTPRLGLPTLVEGSTLAKTSVWLTDQVPLIQQLLDVATLLDRDHTGQVTFEGSGTNSEIEAKLAAELAKGLDDLSEIDSFKDREEATRLAEIFARNAKDPDIAGMVLNEIGPSGFQEAMYSLSKLTNDPSYQGQLDVDYETDPADLEGEDARLEALQDSIATSLAEALGAASKAGNLTDQFAKDLVDESGAWALGTVMQYADKNNVQFGDTFLATMTDRLIEAEQPTGATHWQVNQNAPVLFGSDHGNDKLVDDPLLQTLHNLENNAGAGQIVFQNPEDAVYLLSARDAPWEDPPGEAAAAALHTATVDSAYGMGHLAEEAAKTASAVLDAFGGDPGEDPKLLDATKETFGDILGTYMPDVASKLSDLGLRAPEGMSPEDMRGSTGWPIYGLTSDKNTFESILQRIGDNDDAIGAVSRGAAHYTQNAMDSAAVSSLEGPYADENWTPGGADDPFASTIERSGNLQSSLRDLMLQGAVDQGEDEAKARKDQAELWTLPLDIIPIPESGSKLIDNLVSVGIDKLSEHIEEGYADEDRPEKIEYNGGVKDEGYAEQMRLQAYYSALKATSADPAAGHPYAEPGQGSNQLNVDAIRDAWPTENGHPVEPGRLTQSQVDDIGELDDTGTGLTQIIVDKTNAGWGLGKTN